ncbi:MAG: asparagine synthase (glutamine-hydrolyzing) [Oligoflexia bacterium]|nr:asparagine synthase (glutamine-hydrolyzing) [Oligoflexia bacterium]
MCGIFGLISRNKLLSVDKDLNILKHRGPDSFGSIEYASRNGQQFTRLAHRRLSIIDLSEAANQPMERADLNLSVTFNGEIYNYLELRKELSNKGFSFQTTSDTEIILVGYYCYKERILDKLRGMFAFAIYDMNNGSVFLARDRVGKKPLYYYFKDNIFIFASEIKAILTQNQIDQTYDHVALNKYLQFGYIAAPETIYKNVFSLKAAHFIFFENFKININRYWRINYKTKLAITKVDEVALQLSDIFDQSVKIRMLAADVPVGAFLSGGIDSSAVVAFASKYTDKLKTFSIKFNHSSFDESQYASMIAKKFNTEHFQFTVDAGASFVELLPEIAWHYDQPYADSSALPTYFLSKKTSEHVKVVLSGDGGDESFVGYERYLAHILSEKYELLPNIIKIVIQKLGEGLWSTEPKTFLYRLKRMIQYVSNRDSFERYFKTIQYFNNEDLKLLRSNSVAEKISYADCSNIFSEIQADINLEKIIGFDFEKYLPDDLLVKVDRASMAHSLEVRSPFLDHKLVEFAASIPLGIKFSKYRLKYLLKHHMLKDVLERKILFRPKMGFGVPIHSWFKNELYSYAKEVLMDGTFSQNFNFNKVYIEKLLSDHKNSRSNNSNKLWTLLMLGLWYDRCAGSVR